MTESFVDFSVIPDQARSCLSCAKRLAAMNPGHHCFVCEAKLQASLSRELNGITKARPRSRLRASSRMRAVVPKVDLQPFFLP